MEDEILKALQKEIDQKMSNHNLMPKEEFDNLSPLDMYQLLYNPFKVESPVGFKQNVLDETFDEIPFLKLFVEYISLINEAKELKLTAKGNLTRKICFELYEKKILQEDYIEAGYMKLNKEADSVFLQNLRLIGTLAGITKKRQNKLSLTKKGNNLLKPENRFDLFKEIFIVNCQKLNLGYHDGFAQDIRIQDTFGYTLYLLLQYGKKRRFLDFYAQKSMLAFPYDLEKVDSIYSSPQRGYQNCYGIRIFKRFLDYYGFLDYREEKPNLQQTKTELQTTELFDKIFEIRKGKFKFKKAKRQA